MRAAQAYMLISMPTGTSTIFGVFQAISSSQVLTIIDWRVTRADIEARATPDRTQATSAPERLSEANVPPQS
ncbi:hypothetical protein BRAS3809_2430002 [Bradyrhizobium sp. STM 3809]|nr:hypothetical protein BRAS3809_2430002 [Bradyrhizobium sp. STM 3809]